MMTNFFSKKKKNKRQRDNKRQNTMRTPRLLGTPGLSNEEKARYAISTKKNDNSNSASSNPPSTGGNNSSSCNAGDKDRSSDTVKATEATSEEKAVSQRPSGVPKQEASPTETTALITKGDDDGTTSIETTSVSGINPDLIRTVRTNEKIIESEIKELRTIADTYAHLHGIKQNLFSSSDSLPKSTDPCHKQNERPEKEGGTKKSKEIQRLMINMNDDPQRSESKPRLTRSGKENKWERTTTNIGEEVVSSTNEEQVMQQEREERDTISMSDPLLSTDSDGSGGKSEHGTEGSITIGTSIPSKGDENGCIPVPSNEEIYDKGDTGLSPKGQDTEEDVKGQDENPPSHPTVSGFLRIMEDETISRIDYVSRKIPLDCIQPLHSMFKGPLLQDSYSTVIPRLLSPRSEINTWSENTEQPIPGVPVVPENRYHRYLLDILHLFKHDPSGTICRFGDNRIHGLFYEAMKEFPIPSSFLQVQQLRDGNLLGNHIAHLCECVTGRIRTMRLQKQMDRSELDNADMNALVHMLLIYALIYEATSRTVIPYLQHQRVHDIDTATWPSPVYIARAISRSCPWCS